MCVIFKALTLHSTGIGRKKKPAYLAVTPKTPHEFLHLYNEEEHQGEAEELFPGFVLTKITS